MNPMIVVQKAALARTIIPAFNIPHLPMVQPVIRAIVDEDSIAMIQVARLEWEKFQSKSLEAVALEYYKFADEDHTLLHLDHVPVIDEDQLCVPYMEIIERALAAGYQSCMVDGSRLPFEENVRVTREVADFAHARGVYVEAELGAVSGHESGGIGMDYEQLFTSKKGFTDLDEAEQFAKQSGCDWLSVAVGSVHGAIAEGTKDQKKPQARLDIEHIAALHMATGDMPLVLHGGSGIGQSYIMDAIQNGVVKINVGTEIRQPYEAHIKTHPGDIQGAQQQVYLRVRWVIREFLRTSGNRAKLQGGH